MRRAFAAYKSDVESLAFPSQEHIVEMKDEEWEAFLERIGEKLSG
jgi:hypothetical protein